LRTAVRAAFVVCVLLFAFDFWTVKNVTGRILVGLRWWNEVKPDGTEEWVSGARVCVCARRPSALR
jgi:hypothetical protein